MLCVECENSVACYSDPRVPPLEITVCLCLDCYVCAAEERIDELEFEIDGLRKSLQP